VSDAARLLHLLEKLTEVVGKAAGRSKQLTHAEYSALLAEIHELKQIVAGQKLV